MTNMITILASLGLSKINEAADWLADKIISNPDVNKAHETEAKAAELAATGATTYGIGVAATAGGIALTEALATAGYGVAALEATAAIAAAGTEVAAGGMAIASAGTGVMLIGSALLFSGGVAAKVAVRAAGHAYNFIEGHQHENTHDAQPTITMSNKM
jgi:hypothetical protein